VVVWTPNYKGLGRKKEKKKKAFSIRSGKKIKNLRGGGNGGGKWGKKKKLHYVFVS